MKILKTIFIYIIDFLSLLVFLSLIGSIIWYINKTTPEKMDSCSHSHINDFDVQRCRYRSIEATIYDFNQDIVVAINSNSNVFLEKNQIEFLQKILKKSMGESKKINSIQIVAHSNLIPMKNKHCKNSKCIAKLKASQIEKVVKKLGYRRADISYSRDPFLGEINMKLNGTLLKVLKLNSEIKSLRDELNISKNYNISEVRKRYKQKSELLNRYSQRLEPYNSTVLIISFEK